MKAPMKAQIIIMAIVVYIRPFLWKASLRGLSIYIPIIKYNHFSN